MRTVILPLLLAAACSSSFDSPAIGRLELGRDSSGLLVLANNRINQRYQREFDNPKGVEHMTIVVLANGRLETTCTGKDGARVECSDPPFFTITHAAEGGIDLHVFDEQGERVFDTQPDRELDANCSNTIVTDDEIAQNGDAGPGGTVPTDENFPGWDDPSQTDTDQDTEEPPSWSEPTDNGSTPEQCASYQEILRQQFCAGTNREMNQRNLKGNYACDRLTGFVNPKHGVNINPACVNVLQPVLNEVQATAVNSYGECGGLVEMANTWFHEVKYDLMRDGVCGHSPLVLDLDGDGVQSSSPEGGVVFDIAGDGHPVKTAWPTGADALLAMDRNGNGTVDGAAELFGEYTDGRSFTDGFAALAELDSNHDGVVGVKDAAFGSLRLWIDANRDGVSQRTELRPLAAERITELALTFTRIEGRAAFDAAGNYAAYRSEFTRADGRRGQLVDVYFGFQPRVTK